MDKPPSKISVTIGDEEFEVKLTYGLMLDIMRFIPTPEAVESLILTDPETRDYIVRRCLTKLDKQAENLDQLIDLFSYDVDPDEIIKLQTWVVQHVLFFFMKSGQSLQNLKLVPTKETETIQPLP